MIENIVKNRFEILFLYDAAGINPNGDPADENKPRVDDTGINIVTDVRLKRTIRDYLLTLINKQDKRLENQDIFIKEVRDQEGYLYDAKTRAKDFLKKQGTFNEMKDAVKNDVLKRCIDVRLFGALIPLEFTIKKKPEEGAITLTGPVQFKFGRSLHKVQIVFIKGTGAFASEYPGATQFTFREEFVLPYSLILFHGFINENAAKETSLTQNDVDLLFEAMWCGTKNLITRSKVGQMPRLLICVEYKEGINFHIGSLDRVCLHKDIEDEKIREISQVGIDLTELSKKLETHRDKIAKIYYLIDEDTKLIKNGKSVSLEQIIPSEIASEKLDFYRHNIKVSKR